MVDRVCKCSQCDKDIDENSVVCPFCGGVGKTISMEIKENLLVYDSCQANVINKNKGNKKRNYITIEVFTGYEIRKATGGLVDKKE